MKSFWHEKVCSFGFVVFICFFLIHLATLGCEAGSGQESPICGDGVTEGDEVCDGEDLDGETCESLGLFDGTLSCRADCSGYDVSQCIHEPECGNNIVEEWEACDGSDLNGETCESLGLIGGTLLCRADCSGYNVVECIGEPECGNKIAEEGEECDGYDLRGETCRSRQFVGGELSCGSDCTLDTSQCWKWQGISSGRNHTCGIKSDETGWCWGRNYYGQLGDGTTTDRSIPVNVDELSFITEISGGDDHTCAMRSNGTAWCWGRNAYGQLGDDSTVDQPTPVQVGGLSDVAMISSGYKQACVVDSNGTAWCWGVNQYGQIGDGTTEDRSTPVEVDELQNVTDISSGGYRHACAVASNGQIWCWGGNSFGQLGDESTIDRNQPVQVDGLTEAIQISCKGHHSCALQSDGLVFCWGRNYYGQLGDGTTIDRDYPVQVNEIMDAVEISAGSNHTCARKSDGTVWCWGRNYHGQLGDGSEEDRDTPVQVDGLTSTAKISCGYRHSCSMQSDGTAWCWGGNFNGQLGDWTTTHSSTPVEVISE